MDVFPAIVLGAVQGVTEFLPISSTGHLILARAALGAEEGNALAFDAFLHLATAAAVIVYFRRDIRLLLQTFLRHVGRMPVGARDKTMLFAIIAGTIPAALAGLLLEEVVETALRAPVAVAAVLTAGSLLLAAAEVTARQRRAQTNALSVRTGFVIGIFQMLALAPGMSRSGASISGGMLAGLSRTDATRFAFLLAVPVVLGAGTVKTVEMLSHAGEVAWGPALSGALSAFIVGLLAIRFMLRYLRTHTFWPFIWYRLILAAAIALIVLAG